MEDTEFANSLLWTRYYTEHPEALQHWFASEEVYEMAQQQRVRDRQCAILVHSFGWNSVEGWWDYPIIYSFAFFLKHIEPCKFELRELEEKGHTTVELGANRYCHCYPVNPLPFMGGDLC